MTSGDTTPECTSSRTVLVRDLLIFQLKLALDGVKGLLLFQVSLVAAAVDFVFGPRSDSGLFYRVLAWAERFDLWLNLYAPAETADAARDGLFGTSDERDETLLGRLERAVRSRTEGRGSRPERRRAA